MQIFVYENHRWWMDSSWCDRLLTQERAPWSDVSGNLLLPKS